MRISTIALLSLFLSNSVTVDAFCTRTIAKRSFYSFLPKTKKYPRKQHSKKAAKLNDIDQNFEDLSIDDLRTKKEEALSAMIEATVTAGAADVKEDILVTEEEAESKVDKLEVFARSLLETRLAIEAMEKKATKELGQEEVQQVEEEVTVKASVEEEEEKLVEDEPPLSIDEEEEELPVFIDSSEGDKKAEAVHRSLLEARLAIEANEQVAKQQGIAAAAAMVGAASKAAKAEISQEEEGEVTIDYKEEKEPVNKEKEEEEEDDDDRSIEEVLQYVDEAVATATKILDASKAILDSDSAREEEEEPADILAKQEEEEVVVDETPKIEEDIVVIDEPASAEEEEGEATDIATNITPTTEQVSEPTTETEAPAEKEEESFKSTIPINMSIVPVNEESVEFTSGLVFGAAGLALGGPAGAIAAALIGNYLSRDKLGDNTASSLVQGLSRSVIELYNTIAKIQNDYKLLDKSRSFIQNDVVGRVKSLDGVDVENVSKLEETLSGTTKKVVELNEEYDVVGSAGQVLRVFGDIFEMTVMKLTDLNEELQVTDRAVDAIKSGVEKEAAEKREKTE